MVEKGFLSDKAYVIFQSFNCADGICLSLLGVVTNVLCMRTFLAMGLDKGIIVSFLALTLSDLATSLLTFATFISLIFHVYDFSTGQVMCGVDPLFVFTIFDTMASGAYTVTVLNTTYVATTRCMSVVQPTKFKSIFTSQRAVMVSGSFTIVVVLLTLPLLYHTGLTPVENVACPRRNLSIEAGRETLKHMTSEVTLIFIPLVCEVIVVICMIVLTRTLKKAKQLRKKSLRHELQSSRDRRRASSSVESGSLISKLLFPRNSSEVERERPQRIDVHGARKSIQNQRKQSSSATRKFSTGDCKSPTFVVANNTQTDKSPQPTAAVTNGSSSEQNTLKDKDNAPISQQLDPGIRQFPETKQMESKEGSTSQGPKLNQGEKEENLSGNNSVNAYFDYTNESAVRRFLNKGLTLQNDDDEVQHDSSRAGHRFAGILSQVAAMNHLESRIIRQVVVICALFIACNIPMIFVGILGIKLQGFNEDFQTDRYAKLYYSLHSLRRVIEQINSSVNFFIYLKYSSRFRFLTCKF